jgi:hypothetical protein
MADLTPPCAPAETDAFLFFRRARESFRIVLSHSNQMDEPGFGQGRHGQNPHALSES